MKCVHRFLYMCTCTARHYKFQHSRHDCGRAKITCSFLLAFCTSFAVIFLIKLSVTLIMVVWRFLLDGISLDPIVACCRRSCEIDVSTSVVHCRMDGFVSPSKFARVLPRGDGMTRILQSAHSTLRTRNRSARLFDGLPLFLFLLFFFRFVIVPLLSAVFCMCCLASCPSCS